MDPIMGFGGHDQFTRDGRALTQSEVESRARRRGQCVRCGIQTHKGVLKRPITDENVWQGYCIRCNPDSVPRSVVDEWDLRNKTPVVVLPVNQRTTAAPRLQQQNQQHHSFKETASVVTAANRIRGSQAPAAATTTPVVVARAAPKRAESAANRLDGSTRPEMSQSQQRSSRQNAEITTSERPVRANKKSQPTSSITTPPGSSITSNSTNFNDSGTSISVPNEEMSNSVNSSQLWTATEPTVEKSISVVETEEFAPKKGEDGNAIFRAEEDLIQDLAKSRTDVNQLREVLHDIRNFAYGKEDEEKSPEELLAEDDDDVAAKGFSPLGAGGHFVLPLKDAINPYVGDARVMTLASGAVWRVSACGEKQKEEIVDAGLVALLIDAIEKNRGAPDLCQWAIGALASLSLGTANRELIPTAGGIEAVLETMRAHSKNAGVFEWSCRCLCNLVYPYVSDVEEVDADVVDGEIQQNIATIEESGGIATIVQGVIHHHKETVALFWAIKLLWHLHQRPDEAGAKRVRDQMCNADLLPRAIKILRGRSTSSELFALTSELVSAILLHSGDKQESRFAVVAESIPSVVRLMGQKGSVNASEDMLIQEAGCRLLITLCNAISIVKSEMKDAKALETIVAALEKRAGSLGLLESGFEMLWRLSTDSALISATLAPKICKAMAAASAAHPDARDLTLALCGIIANLSVIPNVSGKDLPMSIVGAALEAFPDDEVICKQAVSALSNVCAAFPDSVQDVTEVMNSQSIPKVIDLFLGSSEAMVDELYQVFSAISRTPAGRKTLMTSGIIPDVAYAVMNKTNDDSSMMTLMDLLAMLLSDPSSPVDLPSDIGNIIFTAGATRKASKEMRMKAFGVVRNLLMVSSKELHIGRFSDVMSEVLNLPEGNEDLIIEACNLVWAYAAKNSSQLTSDVVVKLFQDLVLIIQDNNAEDVEFSEELYTALSGALASISSFIRREPIPVSKNEIDEIISGVYRVIESEKTAKEPLTALLLVLYNLCSFDAGTMVQSGVIVVVIDVMAEREEVVEIQEMGSAILALLASSDDLQINLSIVQTEGVETMRVALTTYPDNERVQIESFKCFMHLSLDPETRLLVVAESGVQLTAQAIKAHLSHEKVLESACGCLFQLTKDMEPSSHTTVLATGVVDALVQALKQASAVSLKESCLGIMENMLASSSTFASSFVSAGGVQAVVAACQEHMDLPAVVEKALRVIYYMAPRNESKIAESDGVAAITNSMLASIEYETVLMEGCKCLRVLARMLGQKIRDAGGVDALVFTMRAHYSSKAIQIEACQAMEYAAENGGVISESEVNALVAVMTRFSRSKDVMEAACNTLFQYTKDPNNKAVVLRSGNEVKDTLSKAEARFASEALSGTARAALARLK